MLRYHDFHGILIDELLCIAQWSLGQVDGLHAVFPAALRLMGMVK